MSGIAILFDKGCKFLLCLIVFIQISNISDAKAQSLTNQYKVKWVSSDLGNTKWCPNETRTITVKIKNNGLKSWTDTPGTDFNISAR